jgi:hypothetical protein
MWEVLKALRYRVGNRLQELRQKLPEKKFAWDALEKARSAAGASDQTIEAAIRDVMNQKRNESEVSEMIGLALGFYDAFADKLDQLESGH